MVYSLHHNVLPAIKGEDNENPVIRRIENLWLLSDKGPHVHYCIVAVREMEKSTSLQEAFYHDIDPFVIVHYAY